jgi:hypothetical protein
MALVGSATVYALSWVAWLVFPMLGVVIVIATRVAAGGGRDLAHLGASPLTPAR